MERWNMMPISPQSDTNQKMAGRPTAGSWVRNSEIQQLAFVLLAIGPGLFAQEGQVAPTWLHRYLPEIHEYRMDLTTSSCHYLPVFGEGDSAPQAAQSVVRFGELTVDAHGACEPTEYPRQEELYFILEGNGILQYGENPHALRMNDFTYVSPTVRHKLSNSSDQPFRVIDLKEQTVEGHPTSVLYKLLIGPHTGTRDRINAAQVVADLFLMDFAPGGTNFPHHHEGAEEIYLVLDGEGQMVAGGGMDGVEGLHPAKAGDAYYFRPNCTVGFYNRNPRGAKAHILAVRAFVPLPKNPD
jgi:mannose-6-phosphate isomerase-like protein (cupin superfamily)